MQHHIYRRPPKHKTKESPKQSSAGQTSKQKRERRKEKKSQLQTNVASDQLPPASTEKVRTQNDRVMQKL